MAAAEGLDLGEYVVQRLHAYAHGVGEVYHPRVRAYLLYFAREALVDGHGTHGAQHAAGARRIAHGLPYAVLFGRVHVAFHLFESAGEYGYDHKVGARERAPDIFIHPVFKF